MQQVEGPGRGVQPRLNTTYQFASSRKTAGSDTATWHALSVYTVVDHYPDTEQERRDLVRTYGPQLVQEWLDRGLPLGELFHLVHRPGELGPSAAQRVHRADQGGALAREAGGVPVVVVLANMPIVPRLVVSKVRFDHR